MLMWIALVALFGAGALVFAQLYFANRLRAEQAQARADVEEYERDILNKDQKVDRGLSDRVVANPGDMSAAIDSWQAERQGLLCLEQAGRTWDWGDDDLRHWSKREIRREQASTRRRLLVPWLATHLVILGLAAGAAAVLYQFHASRQVDPFGPQPATTSWSAPQVSWTPASLPAAPAVAPVNSMTQRGAR
ncbi:hypothetical protein OAX78_00405 [Planctomycetota bacterium]|nr:hypothetical protein [Planctomycetota bacterium]